MMKELADVVVRWLSVAFKRIKHFEGKFLMTGRRHMLQPPSRQARGRIQATTGNLERLKSRFSYMIFLNT